MFIYIYTINYGGVKPPNLVHGRFIHFTADNLDILDETLDGKNTFHATQVAAWQRGQSPKTMLDNFKLSNTKTLAVPEEMEELCPVNISNTKPKPHFREPVQAEWYSEPERKSTSTIKAEAKDIAFNLLCENEVIK